MMRTLEKVKVAGPGTTLVFKDAACVVTMDCADVLSLESTSPLILGCRKDVDVVIRDGKVVAIGPGEGQNFEGAAGTSLASQSSSATGSVEIISAKGLTLMPGLVDAHCHPMFAGSRASETVLKSQGMSYEEIASRGGGISSTTKATRASSDEQLTSFYQTHAQTALARGVVLLEAKTGYGLNPAEELRHLKCLYAAYDTQNALLPQMAPTLLGPHAASPDYHGLDPYVQELIDFLPHYAAAAKEAESRGVGLPLAADIFIERGYFTKEHGDRWLAAALQHGLDVHIHADEFSRSGGSELAIELAQRREQTNAPRKQKGGRVLSVDHCQYATETDLAKLQRLGVVAVVLPTTSFFSDLPYVEAKRMRSSGIQVAIASDFNPGSAPINSLWFAAFLALTRCGFSLPEIFSGVTTNAAKALGAHDNYGQIVVGKPGHLVAFQGTSPEDFFASPLGDHIAHVVLAQTSR